VALSLRIFSSDTSLRPGLACEITPEGVIAARQAAGEQAVMAFTPLAAGALRPGLAEGNFADRAVVVAALRQALDEVAGKQKQLTLVVPDAAVRVLILDFDSLPSKPQEALPIVRFRLRKLAPFEVDDAAVSYQVMRQMPGQMRVLVTVMPADVRAEYEAAVREAGYEPGVLLPSMLASLAALSSSDAALVVNRNGLSLTTAIASGDELLLHRTMELPASAAAQREDLGQAVSVASAYFEDTMHASPEVLYYAGPGGAEAFLAMLGAETEDGLRMVRDLAPTTGSSVPKGLAAGVTGALAS
jgi:type IV pilus assembly protein PilM